MPLKILTSTTVCSHELFVICSLPLFFSLSSSSTAILISFHCFDLFLFLFHYYKFCIIGVPLIFKHTNTPFFSMIYIWLLFNTSPAFTVPIFYKFIKLFRVIFFNIGFYSIDLLLFFSLPFLCAVLLGKENAGEILFHLFLLIFSVILHNFLFTLQFSILI